MLNRRDFLRSFIYAGVALGLESSGLESSNITLNSGINEKLNKQYDDCDILFQDWCRLIPEYTFDNFITGRGNRFACQIAREVVREPGKVYNPLLIYGGAGMGTTHLINAIGNSIDYTKRYKVLYTSSEQFTNHLVYALRYGKKENFDNKYKNADVFIIDDIQFLENRGATQEELFNIFDALFIEQKQIVISGSHPDKLSRAIGTLRSRFFKNGLIIGIHPLAFETHAAILHKKAEMKRMDINEDVINLIATEIKTNIREMEGCMIRLDALSKLTGKPIDIRMAENVLRDFGYISGYADSMRS